MKRFFAAALAATMLLAVLLTAGLFPAAAETALAADNRVLSDGDTLFPGTRVSGWGTPVLDGTKDEEIYQGFSRISDNVDGKGSNASFDIWYANDAEHLYFYLELTVPSGNTNKTALTNNDLTRLYIDFFNQHTQVYRKTDNEYQTQILNTDTAKNQQVAGSASNYNGGQFAYFPLGGSAKGTRGAENGIGSVAGGDVVYKIQYSDEGQADVSGYVIEARIDLPDYIQADINADLQPVIGVGYEVRNNTDEPRYAMTWNDFDMVPLESNGDYFNWLWADYTVAPDLVLSNSSGNNVTDFSQCLPVCAEATGKTVVLDGKMDPSEGWAALPYAYFDAAYDGSKINGGVTDSPRLWLSADAEYVYAFYETSKLDSIWLYIQYAFGEEVDGNDTGLFVEARYDLQPAADGSYAVRYKNSDITYTEGSDFYDNSAFVVVHEADRICVETRIPIPQSVRQARVNGEFPMYIGGLERFTSSSNAGYTFSAGFAWVSCMVELTLPATPALPVLAGFQTSAAGDGTYSVRLVGVMGDYTRYAQAGFAVRYVSGPDAGYIGSTALAGCRYVYTSLLAGEQTVSPSEYNGQYFFCFTIDGLQTGEEYVFEVSCRTLLKGETEWQTGGSVQIRLGADGTLS